MINVQLIESLRLSRGYNQEKMANMMGYDTHTTYNRKIKGKRQFTVEDIVNLCKIFQIEPNDLISLN